MDALKILPLNVLLDRSGRPMVSHSIFELRLFDPADADPLFFLHHGMVDRVWYEWQHRSPENFWAFEGGTVQVLDTLERSS